jgi:hypothetical protein
VGNGNIRQEYHRFDATGSNELAESASAAKMAEDPLLGVYTQMQQTAEQMDPYGTDMDSWISPMSIDMAWLSTLPFDITFDQTIEPLW